MRVAQITTVLCRGGRAVTTARFSLYYIKTLICCTNFETCLFRVATAQGKQGIWLLTFPDRENTGNLVNLIFYTGKIVPIQGKF